MAITSLSSTGNVNTASTAIPISAFVGASNTTAGTEGLVPAPGASQQNDVLYGNGAWGAINLTTLGAAEVAITGNYSDLNAAPSLLAGIVFVIDGGGAVIATGLKGFLPIAYPCTITGWTLLADQSGSASIDIWKAPYASFPPTLANSITAGTPPTLTSAQSSQSGSLTSWVTAVSPGDVLAYNVISCTSATRISVLLDVTRS